MCQKCQTFIKNGSNGLVAGGENGEKCETFVKNEGCVDFGATQKGPKVWNCMQNKEEAGGLGGGR